MGLLPCDRRTSVAVLAAGLLTITCVGLAAWAIRAHHRADHATEDLQAARAEAVRHREAARLAASSEEEARTRAALADSRWLAALSETERVGRPDRAPAGGRGDPSGRHPRGPRQPARCALLTRPSVTAFYHRARGPVWSVAFRPDGKTLAAGCSDGRQGGLVLLCDPSRSTETPLPAPEGFVWAVAFSPDGKTLAAGGGRGVALWDVERRARLGERPLDFPGNSVSSVAFSPDGKTLAAGGSSRVVLWDVARRVRLGELPRLMDDEYPVSSLAFSPDGRTVLTVGGGALALWDAASRKPISEPFGDLDQSIECAAFSPDGKTLAAGLEGVDVDVCAGVALWDMEGRHRLFEQPLAVAGDRVTSVVFGSRILAAGVDDRVVLWDLTRRPPLVDRPQVIAGASITGLALSPDGKRLAAGYRRPDGGAVIWNLEARSPLEDRPLLIDADIVDVAFSPDGSTIAAAYDRGSRGGVAPGTPVVARDSPTSPWRSPRVHPSAWPAAGMAWPSPPGSSRRM